MPSDREITEQILSVWDEEAGEPVEREDEDTVMDTEEPVTEPELEETPAEEPETEEPEEDTEELEEEEEEEEEEPEPEPAYAFQTDDPEVQAFLAKYDGDLEKALKAEAHQQRVIGQQGHELSALRRQNAEMATELERAQTLAQTPSYLTPEQQQWVTDVISEGNPQGAVKAAVDAQEFELARAVCEAWAEEDPFRAGRIANQVDQIEQRFRQQQVEAVQPQQLDYDTLFQILTTHYPDLPSFSARMTELVGQLGDEHMLVQDSRSPDPEVAARGIIGLYEIARASTATVKQTRERVRRQQQEQADTVRANGVVSTATATPSSTETPRSMRRLGPGLTLEQLDEAFDAANK